MYGTVGTIEDFAKAIGLQATVTVDPAPAINHDWMRGASHYRVTLRRDNGRRLTTPYHMGPALTAPPTAAEVLDSLVSDATCATGSFEDFCGDLGYDTDSRKSERMYRLCKATNRKLRQFLGEDFDTACQVERL